MSGQDEQSSNYNLLALLFIVSGEMVVPVLIGLYLDGLTGWRPWLTVAGAVLGFVGGTFHVLSVGQRLGGRRPPPGVLLGLQDRPDQLLFPHPVPAGDAVLAGQIGQVLLAATQ